MRAVIRWHPAVSAVCSVRWSRALPNSVEIRSPAVSLFRALVAGFTPSDCAVDVLYAAAVQSRCDQLTGAFAS